MIQDTVNQMIDAIGCYCESETTIQVSAIIMWAVFYKHDKNKIFTIRFNLCCHLNMYIAKYVAQPTPTGPQIKPLHTSSQYKIDGLIRILSVRK